MAVDHLDADALAALVVRIDAEQGSLDLLVNDIWGGENSSSGIGASASATSGPACTCWKLG